MILAGGLREPRAIRRGSPYPKAAAAALDDAMMERRRGSGRPSGVLIRPWRRERGRARFRGLASTTAAPLVAPWRRTTWWASAGRPMTWEVSVFFPTVRGVEKLAFWGLLSRYPHLRAGGPTSILWGCSGAQNARRRGARSRTPHWPGRERSTSAPPPRRPASEAVADDTKKASEAPTVVRPTKAAAAGEEAAACGGRRRDSSRAASGRRRPAQRLLEAQTVSKTARGTLRSGRGGRLGCRGLVLPPITAHLLLQRLHLLDRSRRARCRACSSSCRPLLPQCSR